MIIVLLLIYTLIVSGLTAYVCVLAHGEDETPQAPRCSGLLGWVSGHKFNDILSRQTQNCNRCGMRMWEPGPVGCKICSKGHA